MKKILLGSAAIIGLSAVAMSTPAMAGSGVKLGLGGHFKGYVSWVDQDEATGREVRELDMLRESEIHFKGKTTLDNGLTVGAKVEFDLDNGPSSNDARVEENYVYFSGSWGRVNFGQEDGAAYLLQVAAPSADNNVDGIAPYVAPVNAGALASGATDTFATSTSSPFSTEDSWQIRMMYAQKVSSKNMKLTYLSPVMNGFQLGVSYTPELGDNPNGLDGNSWDNENDAFGDVFDVAFRYEGQFDELGVTFGAGYTNASLENENSTPSAPFGTSRNPTDDRTAWNVGIDFDWSAFGLGFAYSEDDYGESYLTATSTVDDTEIFVVGVDYTTGPFKLGASYFTADNFYNAQDVDADRWSAGVVYTYGPGMTFRGSVQYLEVNDITVNGNANTDIDATSLLLGTQIKF